MDPKNPTTDQLPDELTPQDAMPKKIAKEIKDAGGLGPIMAKMKEGEGDKSMKEGEGDKSMKEGEGDKSMKDGEEKSKTPNELLNKPVDQEKVPLSEYGGKPLVEGLAMRSEYGIAETFNTLKTGLGSTKFNKLMNAMYELGVTSIYDHNFEGIRGTSFTLKDSPSGKPASFVIKNDNGDVIFPAGNEKGKTFTVDDIYNSIVTQQLDQELQSLNTEAGQEFIAGISQSPRYKEVLQVFDRLGVNKDSFVGMKGTTCIINERRSSLAIQVAGRNLFPTEYNPSRNPTERDNRKRTYRNTDEIVDEILDREENAKNRSLAK